MAREPQTVWKITDDLTGETLAENEVVHVEFTYNGKEFELDLSHQNASEFEALLAPYLNAVAPKRRPRSRFPKSSIENTLKDENQKIRAWAADNGFQVAPRGIIKQEVRDAYHAAH